MRIAEGSGETALAARSARRGPHRRLTRDRAEAREVPRHNLPVPVTSFVGRTDALVEIGLHLGTTRLLTLTGAGGIGKTRLALQVAGAQVDAYADGVWLVQLAAIDDVDRLERMADRLPEVRTWDELLAP